MYGKGHYEYYKNVIQALRGESAAATSGHEALKSLELLISAYRSATEGKTIYLPLETYPNKIVRLIHCLYYRILHT